MTAPGAAQPRQSTAIPLEPSTQEDAPLTSFPSAIIEEMLRVFVKGVRAHQLYLHNNPTYVRALETLRASFAPIWEHTDDFSMQVTETDFVWEQVPVLREAGKTADSLPWLFYKDGVRELRFQKGFEEEDLVGFLDIIQRARRQNPDEDDLLVMLWERDLLHLRYKYVELSDDGGLGLGELTPRNEPHTIEPPRADDPVRPEEQLLESRPGLVNLADFDATLYFLDEGEVAYLRQEVEAEYAGDTRQNVIGILLDIFEVQEDPVIRDEISAVLDLLIVHFLSAHEFRAVAYLLNEARVATGRAGNLAAAQRDRLDKVPDQLSQADALSQLLESFEQSAALPPVEDLTALFAELRPRAMETVFAWLPRIQDPRVRDLLQGAATRLTAANTERARSAHWRRESQGRPRSGPSRRCRSKPGGRDGARASAGRCRCGDASGCRASVGRDRICWAPCRGSNARSTTSTAMCASRWHEPWRGHGYRPALPRFEAAVKAKALREADLTEKMAMFEAFGVLGGEAGVPLLDGVLNARGFLGKRDDSETRACAAMALGRIGTEVALESLRRARNEKDVVVRNAVNKALRGAA